MNKITFLFFIAILAVGFAIPEKNMNIPENIEYGTTNESVVENESLAEDNTFATETVEESYGTCGGIWLGILRFTKTTHSITVNWNHGANSSLGTTPQYIVHWRNGKNSKSKAVGNVTSYTIPGLGHSTNFKIYVERICNTSIDKGSTISVTTCGTSGCGYTVTNECRVVTGLNHSNLTPNSVTLFYTTPNDVNNGKAGSWEHTRFYIWVTGTPESEAVPAPDTNRQRWDIPNVGYMQPNTTYSWKVVKSCKYAPPASQTVRTVKTYGTNFTTPPPSCRIPNTPRLGSVSTSTNTITFEWDAVGGADYNSMPSYYRVGILESGRWRGFNVGSTNFVWGLTPGRAYAIVVRTHCRNGGVSDWSNVFRYTAPRSRSLKAKTPTSLAYEENESSIIYPNTNHGEFTIKFKDNGKQLRAVTIFNMAGMKVFHEDYNRELDEESYNLTDKLSSGMYKVQISSEDGIEYKTIIVE